MAASVRQVLSKSKISIFCFCVALCRGNAKPGIGLYVIHGNAFAVAIHETQIELRRGMNEYLWNSNTLRIPALAGKKSCTPRCKLTGSSRDGSLSSSRV